MATGKKNTNTRSGSKRSPSKASASRSRGTASRSAGRTRRNTAPERRQDGFGREIAAVVLIFAGVILGIFSYFGSTGILAKIAPALFSLFGVVTYAMPVLLIALGVLMLVFEKSELAPRSIVCAAVIVFSLITVIHVLTVKDALVKAPFGDSIRSALELGSARRGGGFFGGLFGWVFVQLLGVTGGVIALIGAALIAGLLLTHFSISARLKKLRESHRAAAAARREKRPLYTDDLADEGGRKKRTAKTDETEDDGFIEHTGKPLTAGDSDYGYGRRRKQQEDPADKLRERDGHSRRRNPKTDDGPEFFPVSGPLHTGKLPKKRSKGQELKDSFNTTGETWGGVPASHPAAGEKVPSRPPVQPAKTGADPVFADVELDFDEPDVPSVPAEPAENADGDALEGVVISRYDEDEGENPQEPIPPAEDVGGEAVEAAPIEPTPVVYEYRKPPLTLLKLPEPGSSVGMESPEEKARILIDTLASFNISARIINISVGPVITRFELQPAQGVRVNRVTALNNDIQLALAAPRVRIEAPIPGKSAIGVEIPNKSTATVLLRELLEAPEFSAAKSPLTFALGKDIAGKVVLGDLGKMPHMLVAGQTGSGKSVCINGIILSMIYKSSPKDVRMILIDPKVVELSIFSTLPHLFCPVVTDPKKAAGALRWAVNEMDSRYKKMGDLHARDIDRYNAIQTDENERWPRLVIIIDELADLMIVAAKDVEDSIVRIAQLGRACGIHLIVATQRPSVDVITGLIKANIPSRIAFAVSNGIDSRVILDASGAEKLLGRGDMLFHPNGASKPTRAQGAYVDDEEVEAIAEFFAQSAAGRQDFHEDMLSELTTNGASPGQGNGKQEDELLPDAVRLVIESGQASISMIQRRLRVGYARAARLIDIMEQKNYVSPADGAKPRRVLIDAAEFNRVFGGEIHVSGGVEQ